MKGLAGLHCLTEVSDNLFTVSRNRSIVLLRWVVIFASSSLLLSASNPIPGRELIRAWVLLHVASNALLYVARDGLLSAQWFTGTLIVFDTLALSFSLIVTGNLGTDLYLLYFLVIIIAAFWQDIRYSLAFAALISAVYGSLLFLAERRDAELLLRVPFLFCASVFYGYFTQLIHTERAARQQAELEARRDFLTGLPNRKAFDERIKEEQARAARYGRSLSLLMLDIDNFKAVNDAFGHDWGDRVLRLVAGTLRDAVRQGDFAARYGGEEFAVILPETRLADAVALADRIRLAIKQTPLQTPQGLLLVTVSIGASCRSLAAGDPPVLDHDADRALYIAKRKGKDRVESLHGPVLH
ncbi:MAG TPA: GGDEF domain-containing protein [candidate division Zixibacteria bacterium]|nr:GGDEF domain-containing protein [candidate division Zixibacteria bacterium]